MAAGAALSMYAAILQRKLSTPIASAACSFSLIARSEYPRRDVSIRCDRTSVAARIPSASRSKVRGSANCMNSAGRSRTMGIDTSW
jgi:hypothetical protein